MSGLDLDTRLEKHKSLFRSFSTRSAELSVRASNVAIKYYDPLISHCAL